MQNKPLAEKYLRKAFELHLTGKLDDAMIKYKISIDLYPTTEAHTYLGWAYSMLGNYDQAISECRTAIILDQDFGNPYDIIGSRLLKMEKEEEAINWFMKAIDTPRFDPKHLAFFNLGKIFRKKGDWFKAISMFKEALKINPHFEPARKEMFRLVAYLN